MALHRFARLTTALTLVLLLMGGLVHNTRSSLICPDWPTCNGQYLPAASNFQVLLEHYLHRAVATTVGALVLLLAVLAVRRAARTGDRTLGWAASLALLLVCVVGALGRYTVLHRLPTWTSTSKLALGTTALLLLAFTTQRLAPRPTRRAAPDGVRPMATAGAVLVFVQMVLGAYLRHSGAGLVCWDLPRCEAARAHGLPLSVVTFFAHEGLALLLLAHVTACALLTVRRAAGRSDLKRLAAASMALAWIQALLGVVSVRSFLDVVPVTAHLLCAELLLLSLAAIAAGATRSTRAQRPIAAPARAGSEVLA